jgi:hypothetical protein
MGGAILKSPATLEMSVTITTRLFIVLVVCAVASAAHAQSSQQRREQKRAPEPAAPAVPIDKRDSTVTAAGAFNGHPYWLALAQCGGIYFKLNVFYTDIAVRARVVKPDPTANAEYSKKLTEAIKTATTFFNGAERFLMTDRGLERADAVLTYDGPSRAAGEKLKSVDAALAAAKACPALYQSCHDAFAKQCSESLAPTS